MATVNPERMARRKAEELVESLGGTLCPASDWERVRTVFDWSPAVGGEMIEHLAERGQVSFELAMRAAKDDPGAAGGMLRAMARWNEGLPRTGEAVDDELDQEELVEFLGAAWEFGAANPRISADVRREIERTPSMALHLLRRRAPEDAVRLSLRRLEAMRNAGGPPPDGGASEDQSIDYANAVLNLALLPEYAGPFDTALFDSPLWKLDKDETKLFAELARFMRDFSERKVVELIVRAEERAMVNEETGFFLWAVLEVTCPHLLIDVALLFSEKLTMGLEDSMEETLELRLLYHLATDYAEFAPLVTRYLMPGSHLRMAAIRHIDSTLIGERIARLSPLPGMCLAGCDTLRCLYAILDDPEAVPHLIAFARKDREEVRAMALTMLSFVDDPRCANELLDALGDPSPEVREYAERLLLTEPRQPGFMENWTPVRRAVWVADRLAALSRAYAWAARTGYELTGRGTEITQYRTGIGRTVASADGPMRIEVSSLPIASGHPQGEAVVKGILLHEIGHHVFDIGAKGARSARGQARRQGVTELYDILMDERMERRLRSRRDAFGAVLDRTLTYVFAELPGNAVPLDDLARALDRTPDSLRRDFEDGRLEGRLEGRMVRLTHREQVQLGGTVSRMLAFFFALRAGFSVEDRPADAAVRRALAQIPPTFRNLGHPRMVHLAIRIREILELEPSTDNEIAEILRRLRRILPALDATLKRLNEVGGHLPEILEDDGSAKRGDVSRSLPRRTAPPDFRKTSPARPRPLSGGLGFTPLDRVVPMNRNPAAQNNELRRVRQYVRPLRAFMERAGTGVVEDRQSRRGQRIDPQGLRRSMLHPGTGLFINREVRIYPDAYVGLLIDRSGSMCGRGMGLARSFGVLLAEALKDLPGITGHIHAFDDETLYDLGDFRRHAIAMLQAGGGNNDCGALHYAARLAQQSRKRNRLLIMISDGQPTDGCCPASLTGLVDELESRWGINCVQVAVEPIQEPSFKQYFDLSTLPYGEAVARFGRLVEKFALAW
ncbi:VWA containing CoxE family protein [Pseudodesulfovibrio mercurii]|uniref:VWA containing CoxE family protein n=1 Tax=Pseudodesulfovibrio mercurii TaxID=641491 RepID=F0JCH9_9BACT|nr:HEAT repeat domain-containing protein [Pseudodesulfovibrio mercurii]EGB15659.1 VWA containing CoxE family protein [Pseudodesulfovibrio mercurii]